jgi:dihydrofolate synthase/folylpolyglutamate synthase
MDYIYTFVDYERQGPTVRHWDLKRIYALLERLGNPNLKTKTVHIAGSKGKGSTAAMIASILSAAGYKTGLFTSPHLHLYNERIRIDNSYITNDEIVSLLDKIKPHIEAVNREDPDNVPLSTFEITTAIGFVYFAEKKADYQVIEVGLGGRLDATNVVSTEVTVITSLSLEHTDMLGSTLTAIAGEKAGIIKPGVPCVVSPQQPEADAVIEKTTAQKSAPLIKVGRDVTAERLGIKDFRQTLRIMGRLDQYDVTIPLLGKYQLDNASAAVGAIEVLIEKGATISHDKIIKGMKNVSWEGRLQVLNNQPLVVVDGAHNRDSAHKLPESLRQYFNFEQAVLVIGMSSDKDVAGIVEELAPAFDTVIATRSNHPRSMLTAPIVNEFRKHGIEAKVTDDVSKALPLALSLAGKNDLVCVTGSLFVVAGAIEKAIVLGLKP